MQGGHVRYGNVRIQTFMLRAICPVADVFRSTFEMNRKAIAAHAGIERLVAKVQVEYEFIAVIRNSILEIVDQKLWRDSSHMDRTSYCLLHHRN